MAWCSDTVYPSQLRISIFTQFSGSITFATEVATKYWMYQKAVKNLRREVYLLRKKSHGFEARLKSTKHIIDQPALNEIFKRITPFAKLLMMMQIKQTPKHKKGRRFTVDEKILSLSIYKKTPKCYGLISQLFTLPSSKSLKRLLSKVIINPGVGNDLLFKNLKKQVGGLILENRLCSLIFDEMSITPQMQYNSLKALDLLP